MAASELLLISKIIQEGDLQPAVQAGLKPDHFTGEFSNIWLWIIKHHREHGAVPSERAFLAEYGDIDFDDTSRETFTGLISEVIQHYKERVLVESLTTAVPALDDHRIDDALKALASGVQKAVVESARIRDVDIIKTWEERLERYEMMRNTPNALRGIPTGFNGLDKITYGLRPQQFIVLVGEQKRGKSLIALLIANSAHVYGKRPLFVSFEMSVEEQVARYDAISSRVPYTNILSGNITKAEMSRIRKTLSLKKNMHPFMFSEDTSSLTTVSALASKIQEYQPELLIVDGVYMMDDEEGEPKGSPQALTNITRALKRLAQRFDIPIVATTQVLSWKINNKRTRAVTADSIGYSSSFAQDADLVLGVERNPDIEDQAIIRVVIARSAPTGEVHIKWDWDTMEFEEVRWDGSSYDDSFD
jgi:replicative DNA helicase